MELRFLILERRAEILVSWVHSNLGNWRRCVTYFTFLGQALFVKTYEEDMWVSIRNVFPTPNLNQPQSQMCQPLRHPMFYISLTGWLYFNWLWNHHWLLYFCYYSTFNSVHQQVMWALTSIYISQSKLFFFTIFLLIPLVQITLFHLDYYGSFVLDLLLRLPPTIYSPLRKAFPGHSVPSSLSFL